MVEKYLLSFTVWNVFKSSFDASCVELQFLTPEMSLIAFMSLITNAHAIDIGHSNQWSSTLSLRYSIYSICIRDGYELTKNQPKPARNGLISGWFWLVFGRLIVCAFVMRLISGIKNCSSTHDPSKLDLKKFHTVKDGRYFSTIIYHETKLLMSLI